MNDNQQVIQQAKKVLHAEANVILTALPKLDESFAQAVQRILAIQGRVIVTGMGKPGYIARKIAATLMSTGTPAGYLHPAEGIHGDLGMITRHDIILMISNSGETAEIIRLIPVIRRIGVPIIAICGNAHSTLARHADVVIDASVEHEACPLNLAPTTSTTLALALGDALAVVLMQSRCFSRDDFALFHPGGTLGRNLLLTVEAVMHSGQNNPTIHADQTIAEALFVMTEKGMGATSVIDENGKLSGLITDGDIRRCITQDPYFLHRPAAKIMTRQPLAINKHRLVTEAIYLMENHQPQPITLLPVLDNERTVVGMIHITDLMRTNIAGV